jgi:hypothetical protein
MRVFRTESEKRDAESRDSRERGELETYTEIRIYGAPESGSVPVRIAYVTEFYHESGALSQHRSDSSEERDSLIRRSYIVHDSELRGE